MSEEKRRRETLEHWSKWEKAERKHSLNLYISIVDIYQNILFRNIIIKFHKIVLINTY